MRRPEVNYDRLLGMAENKYSLAVAVAKRARELHDGALPALETEAVKPVTKAIDEFAAGKLRYVRRVSDDDYVIWPELAPGQQEEQDESGQ